MDAKSIFRFALGIALAVLLLGVALSVIGVPPSRWVPPPLVYANARAKTMGVVTGKYTAGTANPFRVGEKTYYVQYRFRAPEPEGLGARSPGQARDYTGTARVGASLYQAVAAGQPAPIAYEPTFPVISGIASPQGGRNVTGASGLLSGWLAFLALTLILGYSLASVLQKMWPREFG